ncbi:LA_2272 family surface repeat-containing protein [uncultured Bacteroides sp.]|uniref:LA_2272 family surface repeat-containing protein n=1 Tax=uncultured Bacteroides sp. TaxID=162156 RepID=UPI002AAB88CB|nr:hypothetical protein [uncultured Bacteroides sp.]
MKRRLIVAALLIIPLSILFAQETAKHPLNISLWDPIASFPYDSLSTTAVTLGFSSRTYNLKGVGINMFAHFNEKGVRGVTLNGVGEFAKGNMNGAEISGLFNVVSGHMHGLQIATVQNTNVLHSKGIMIAGITNFAIGDARGIQIAGITNMAGSHFSGVQFSSAVNIASSSSDLLQIAGLVNVCAEPINGIQIALGNYAGGVNGVQMGLLNLCGGDVRGVQIGIINHSKDTSAVKIGLVNITPKTRIQLLTYGGNTTRINTAVRFKNHHVYTILGIGTHYLGLNDKFSGSLFYRAGAELPVTKKLFLSSDAGFYHIENFNNEDLTTPERMYSLQLRLNMEYHLLNRLGVLASGGYAHTRYYKTHRIYENKPVIELGIVLF